MIPKDLIVDLVKTDSCVSYYVNDWLGGRCSSYETMLQELVVSLAQRHKSMLELVADMASRTPVRLRFVLGDAPVLQEEIRKYLRIHRDEEASLIDFSKVYEMIDMPDYAVAFALWPWPDGGWKASVVLLSRWYAEEQGLTMALANHEVVGPRWDVDQGFAMGLCASGSNPQEAIDELYGLVERKHR